MPVVQDAFYIPPEIYDGLLKGIYRRFGSVVRYATGPKKGQIYKHLDPAPTRRADEAVGLLEKAAKFAKNNKTGILIGGVAVIVVGGCTALYFGIKNREPAEMKDFEIALAVYIEAIRKGNMDLDTIETLMTALEAMRQHKKFSQFSLTLSARDIDALVVYINKYTMKLAEENGYAWAEDEIDNSNGPILNLQKYLMVQKEIFRAAA